jgi:hypothetical protein
MAYVGVHSETVFFKIIGQISDVEKIASGKGIRERRRLSKLYGGRRWGNSREPRWCSSQMVGWVMPSCTGTKRTARGQKSSRLSGF